VAVWCGQASFHASATNAYDFTSLYIRSMFAV
jgi:hypothetical protein